MEILEVKPKNMLALITVVQSICMAIILITLLIIKLGFSKSFYKVQKWCKNNVLEPTYVTDVFDGEENSEN